MLPPGLCVLAMVETMCFKPSENENSEAEVQFASKDFATFLAIDRNGNGLIDDRSELFGGAVGEGFGTLASFDSNADGRMQGRQRCHHLALPLPCGYDHGCLHRHQ